MRKRLNLTKIKMLKQSPVNSVNAIRLSQLFDLNNLWAIEQT